jgi:predicted nucleic acid-binding protein
MILLDTNILIEAFKRNKRTIEIIEKIGEENVSISSITQMELYYGALNKGELGKIKKALSNLMLYSIDEHITGIAVQLIETYAKSHGLTIPDAIIATTAREQNLELLTYNMRDFQFIKNLTLFDEQKMKP